MLLTVAALLEALSGAAVVAGISNAALSKWTAIASALLREGEEARAALEALTRQVQNMVDEGRDPTAEEWAGLAARSDAAHRAIQDWRPEA